MGSGQWPGACDRIRHGRPVSSSAVHGWQLAHLGQEDRRAPARRGMPWPEAPNVADDAEPLPNLPRNGVHIKAEAGPQGVCFRSPHHRALSCNILVPGNQTQSTPHQQTSDHRHQSYIYQDDARRLWMRHLRLQGLVRRLPASPWRLVAVREHRANSRVNSKSCSCCVSPPLTSPLSLPLLTCHPQSH